MSNQLQSFHQHDSEFIRETFRLFVRWAILLLGAFNLFYSATFLYLDSEWWQWSALMGLLQLACYPLTLNRRPFYVFLIGLILMGLCVLVEFSMLYIHLGAQSGFHYLTLVITPIIMFAGRIKVWHKNAACFMLLILMLVVEYIQNNPENLPFSNNALNFFRLINLGAVFVVSAVFMQRHFVIFSEFNAALEKISSTDPLTGMLNRRRLETIAKKEVEVNNQKGTSLSVILADIDHFKLLNDQYGHSAGDDALQIISQIIMKVARDTDSCCRWGGEEFLIFLPNTTTDEAMHVAERIRQKVCKEPLEIDGNKVTITLTSGVATLYKAESLNSAIARADKGLYNGKFAGRNQVKLSA
jgi:diguanylate cyclase (GGDEF)-like protein